MNNAKDIDADPEQDMPRHESARGKSVRIPKFHYRDIHRQAGEILETAKSAGSLKASMVDYLLKRKNRLPEGLTAEAAVVKMLESTDGFLVAHEEGKTQQDIANAIREGMADMEGRQALIYLAILEETFEFCDIRAVGSGEAFDPDEFERRVGEIEEGASEGEVQARIDRLAEMICGDSLLAYVYAGGNEDIRAMVQSEDIGENPSPEGMAAIRQAIEGSVPKAELYAATVCACYGAILDGKVEGVDASNAEIGVMSALVVAGLEKASILRRLMRGEIDEELAKMLLDNLARALKWVLVKALQLLILVSVAVATMFLLNFAGWLVASAPVMIAVGLVVGFWTAVEFREDIEGVVEFLGGLADLALKAICGAFNWVAEKVGGLVGNAAPARDKLAHPESESAFVPAT